MCWMHPSDIHPFPGCHKLLPGWSQVFLGPQSPRQYTAVACQLFPAIMSFNCTECHWSVVQGFVWTVQSLVITQVSCCGSASYSMDSESFWPKWDVVMQLMHEDDDMGFPEIGSINSISWVASSWCWMCYKLHLIVTSIPESGYPQLNFCLPHHAPVVPGLL